MNRLLFKYLGFLLIVLFLVSCTASNGPLSPEKAWSKVQHGAILVDVRTEAEFKVGHLSQAINIPLSTIQASPTTVALDKSDEIVLYCRSGNRAGQAKAILENHGYRRVYNAGGYSALASQKPNSETPS